MRRALDRYLELLVAPACRVAQDLLGWFGRSDGDAFLDLTPSGRRWLLVSVVAYLVAVTARIWVDATALAALAALTAVALGAAWHAAGRTPWVGFAAALWLPLHLLLLLSGAAAPALLPLTIVWLVGIGLLAPAHHTAAAAVAAWTLIILAEGVAGSLTGPGILAAGIALAAGAALGILVAVQRSGSETELHRLARIDAEATADSTAPEGRAALRLREIERVLDTIRIRFGATRAVIWKVQHGLNRARPAATAGLPPPTPVSLSGSHLAWAWEEELPLRLEGALSWAPDAGGACIAPLGTGRVKAGVFTLEWSDPDSVAELAPVAESAALLHALLGAHRREARAVAARARADRLLELAGRLPERLDPLEFAAELAESARALVRGTGAAVATWDGESGHVLAVVGEDGGPVAGAEFTAGGSELALAARGATTLRRRYRRTESRALPVGAPGERWYSEPLALCVLPLSAPGGPVMGLLAVWSAEEPALDPDGLTALEGIAPFAAVHLRQARAYGALVASAAARPGR